MGKKGRSPRPPISKANQCTSPSRTLSLSFSFSFNYLYMSDVNSLIIDPLKQFVKDSAHLVKRCTKPDKNGNTLSLPTLFLAFIYSITYYKILFRVFQSGSSHWYWFPHHGIHRILCEAYSHSDQQYHCRRNVALNARTVLFHILRF